MPAALGPPCVVVSEHVAQLTPECKTQWLLGWSAQKLQAASGSMIGLGKSQVEPRLPPIQGGSAAGTNQAVLDPLPGCDHNDRHGVNS